MQKQFFATCIALIALLSPLKAQDFLGIRQSNYAGVHGIDLNPASIADSRFKLDISLAGGSFSAYNNYIGVNLHDLRDTVKLNDPDFYSKYTAIKQSSRDKSIYQNLEIQFPSFMTNINDREAIGLTIKWRTMTNLDGISDELATLVREQLEYPSLWVQQLENRNLSLQSMTWVEYGGAYARVLRDKDEHFFKMGARLKFLQGLGAVYMFISDLDYEFQNSDTISIFKSKVDYGHSTNFEIQPDNLGYKFISKPGFGLDIGAVYEWRPNYEDYKYDMDGQEDLWRRDKSKYKLRVGLSVTDMGAIRFDKGIQSRSFEADISLADIDTFSHIEDVYSFDSTMNAMFVQEDDIRTFNMNLPTAISLQLDYHIWNDFYVNVQPFWAVQWSNNKNKVHHYTNYSITPRYDYKWAGVSVPVSVSSFAGTRVGLGLRLGPVFLGTSNISALFKNTTSYGADVWAAVKVPIYHPRPKDDDEDKVSNKLDECPEKPGVWAFKGCPDTDGDGIQDTEDDCPAEAGLLEFKGCPDTDEDGIPDKLDSCATVAGLPEFNGCPDTDKDGIQDAKDDCVDIPGIAAFNGCPDTDEDGLKDEDDLCPDVAGPIENQGCPDTDNDGIFDYLDACPTEAGPGENKGCPWPDTDGDGLLDKDDRCPNNAGPKENEGCPYKDTDGDGILDKDDQCPNVPGVPENFGCPQILEEEQEIINTAFDNLEFETGKDVIRATSYPSLVELAELLKKKTDWKLLIAGHTDNVGSARNNEILSKKRAEAVAKFLTENGVHTEALTVEWFGETQPIADNDTDEDRQKNRRVEMTIVFE